MSLSDEFEYRGAEPDQELWRIYKGIAKSEGGNLVTKFVGPKYITSELLDEHDTYKYMDCYRLGANLPDTTDNEKKAYLNQSEVFHYALAELQKEKLQQGLTLDMPLTPHPRVDMGLRKPKVIISQEID